MIGAGRLINKIKIYSVTTIPTATGHNETKTLVGEIFGQVVELSTRARMTYGSIQGDVTHEVRVRGELSFPFGKTQFESSGMVLEPLRPAGHPGHTRRGYSFVPCQEVSEVVRA